MKCEKMKTDPTDIDREAATLFTPAPGMRTWQAADACTIGPRRVIEAEASGAEWIAIRTEGGWSWLPVCALDTDDPATVGCMLAQVEHAEGLDMPVEVYRVTSKWFETDCPGGGGPTRGAAIVSAMRAFKGAVNIGPRRVIEVEASEDAEIDIRTSKRKNRG